MPVPNNTNFSPWASPLSPLRPDLIPAEPVYTEVARSFIPTVGQSPLSEIFPIEEILERTVTIHQYFEAAYSIWPLADWGKPDVVTGFTNGAMQTRSYQPLVIRNTKALSYGEMNIRLRPGTSERWRPEEQIVSVIENMVREHNLTWDVYRAMMLLGGIDYTDSLTGASARVPAEIPLHNIWNWSVSSGYKGRADSSVFLDITDNNSVQPTSQGTPWTHPNADVLGTIQKISSYFSTTNKSRATDIYMSRELAHILAGNNQVKMARGATVFGLPGGATSRDTPDPDLSRMFTMDNMGLSSINGLPVKIIETIYRDQATGLMRSAWPKNKVVIASRVAPDGSAEAPGRTQFCVSEQVGTSSGLWVRTIDNSIPPAAPAMMIQMGNAGLPYLRYPYRVVHMTVSSVGDVNARLGAVGDLSFGVI